MTVPTAETLARALENTATRHRAGFLSHGAYKSHMRSLWNRVDALGLRADVLALVDPAVVGLRPLHEARIMREEN